MAFFPQQKYQRYGKYILLDRINVGGMAEVFRGRQFGVEGFARNIALKRILPNISKDEDFKEMFIDEAKLTVQLQHANVVQVYDLGSVDDRFYIAMEYVSGADLRTIWDRARKRNRLLPIAMSCYLVMKACEGLDYVHRKKDDVGKEIGLVHRDVSPQNLLVSYEGEIKVVDFGIALARSKVSKSQAGVLKGKFGYMSPEQVRGVDLDHRSDIFACGIMLWELLVGDRLFLGESDFSTLEKVRNVEMVPPTHFNKNLSPQVERIVMKALAKNRDDRYRYASEMAEDLQRFLYSSNQPFARTDLQRYMHQHFAEEIKAEQDRLEKYRELKEEEFEPAPGAPQATAPSSSTPGMRIDPGVSVLGMSADGKVASARIPTALKPRPVTFTAAGVTPPQQAAEPNFGSIAIPGDPAVRSSVAPPLTGGLAIGTPVNTAPPQPRRKLPWVVAGLATMVAAMGVVVALFLINRGSAGTLSVDATPSDVEVLIDDKKVADRTPFLRDLEPGAYVLTVRRTGYRELVRPVKIVAGQVDAQVLVLEQLGGTASVIVRATPVGLAVWLNGTDTTKKTPATITPLAAGEYTLELRQDGEAVYATQVKLSDGAAEMVEVDLTRIPPVLEISSAVAGAEVWVDGKKLGLAPVVADKLTPGSVQVQVRKPKCESAVETVELKPAAKKKLVLSPRCP